MEIVVFVDAAQVNPVAGGWIRKFVFHLGNRPVFQTYMLPICFQQDKIYVT